MLAEELLGDAPASWKFIENNSPVKELIYQVRVVRLGKSSGPLSLSK